MKKQILLILTAAVLVGGCTTKEQDVQIRTFWLQQYATAMSKVLEKQMKRAQQQMQQLSPKDREAMQKMLAEMQTNKNFSSENLAMPRPNATGSNTPVVAPQRATARKPQIMDVTLEDDVLPGKAPYEDRVKMQQALNAFRQNNQNTLADIGNAFNEQVKSKAFYITAQTEKSMKQTAETCADFQAFSTALQKAAAQQNKQLRQLMTQNKNQLKKLRR